jgi:geranylgeranyl pyrophosphate synthase
VSRAGGDDPAAEAAPAAGAAVAIDPAAAPPAVARLLEETVQAIDRDIDRRLPLPAGAPGDPELLLVEAMRYAALGPGKRLRPALVRAACEAVGAPAERALPAATAVELLHTYTLVHDDLPAMDDDDERRGRPTVHRAYGEATAILAGDGLLTAAFAALADLGPRAGEAVAVLARRSGAAELLAGQALDLAAAAAAGGGTPRDVPGGAIGLAALERIHAHKTGALFAAACELGAIAGGAGERERRALADYGMEIGIAFQHADDLDDADFAEHREAAAARRVELVRQAIDRLRPFGARGGLLSDVARWIGGI